MLLSQRPPSANWEPIPLDPSGQFVAWVWFRPAALPMGLMFAIPSAAFTEPTTSSRLSLRQLVMMSGLDPAQIQGWMVSGMTFDAAGGASPLLDQILPVPAAGTNLEVSVWTYVPSMPVWPDPTAGLSGHSLPTYGAGMPGQSAMPQGGVASDGDSRLLAAIESAWDGILQLEVRISSIRKELSSAVARLSSLNRDLSSDERRTCDSRDVQDWTDARRWLRDSLSVLSRSVKEIDVGTTSGAGQRHKFEEIYRKYVVPKVPFAGLAQSVNEFESHRKTVQNVLAAAQGNISKAGRDAEQRANGVLQRIRTKMRSTRR